MTPPTEGGDLLSQWEQDMEKLRLIREAWIAGFTVLANITRTDLCELSREVDQMADLYLDLIIEGHHPTEVEA